jgi:hypothetical protein
MTAAPALIALVAPAMDQPVLLALSAGARKPSGLPETGFESWPWQIEICCVRTGLGRKGLRTELAT